MRDRRRRGGVDAVAVRGLLVVAMLVGGCVGAGTPASTDPAPNTSMTTGPSRPTQPESSAPQQSDAPIGPSDAIVPALTAYAAEHADEFGGLYIDQANGGAVVTLWTGHLADHEAAIRKLLSASARLGFRQVRYTEAELRAVQDRATTDMAWLGTIPAAMLSSSVDVIGNTAEIGISSANPDAVRLVRDHFKVPDDMLRVVSDGTGIALRQPGSVVGHLRTANGRPATGYPYDIEASPVEPIGPIAGTGHIPDQNGRYEINGLAPVRWRIDVYVEGTIVASGTIKVPEGGQTTLDLIIPELAGSSQSAT